MTPASKPGPQPRTGDDGAEERAKGQAAQERASATLLVHAEPAFDGPRTATTVTMPIPIQAMIDAPTRW